MQIKQNRWYYASLPYSTFSQHFSYAYFLYLDDTSCLPHVEVKHRFCLMKRIPWKSVGTTELHYSTKMREHSAKRVFPLFRAIEKDSLLSALYLLFINFSIISIFYIKLAICICVHVNLSKLIKYLLIWRDYQKLAITKHGRCLS